jgi:natural product precursor
MPSAFTGLRDAYTSLARLQSPTPVMAPNVLMTDAMKKTKALSFKKETIRTLSSQDLKAVVGGGAVETGLRCNIVGNATGGCGSETSELGGYVLVNSVRVYQR